MNIPDISPEYKFRAVPRSNEMPDDPLYFTLEEAMWDSGSEKFRRLTDRKLYHPPDQFTGHTDKDGREMYGGDVVKNDCCIGFVIWYDGAWAIKYQPHERDRYGLPSISTGRMWNWDQLIRIGNIHNPDTLPEEVRGMLK